jgi:hypothetical protein
MLYVRFFLLNIILLKKQKWIVGVWTEYSKKGIKLNEILGFIY